ncbi:hypothetical protein HMSSN139_35110 [Paenibacillus sp. HMSSN-139]|nr:hypothetical protein HMSSN139_35110 [Paenibacillus sp. HMSSN-139]
MAYQLQNEQLGVKIAELGEVYRGTRFDGAGFITGVELNGRHQFCVPESLVPGSGTGGIGLCSEFGIKEAIGYEETRGRRAFSQTWGRLADPSGRGGIPVLPGIRLQTV